MLIDAFDRLPSPEELAALDPDDLCRFMAGLEARRREVEAHQVAVLQVVAARGLHRADGHRSVSAWHRATVTCSSGAAMRRVRTARLVAAVPAVATAMASGELGVEQAHELGRAHANPRCGHRLVEVADTLIEAATTLPFEDFRAVVRRWEMLADLDGAHRRADAARRDRRAALSLSTFGFHLEASGPKLEGAAMVEIFERFRDAEFRADLHVARQVAGDGVEVTGDLLPRTAAQRAFDALFEIFRRAAAGAPGARMPEPLVNVVVDARTLSQFLHHQSGAAPSAGPTRAGIVDLADVDRRCCGTVDGHNLTPADVLTAALWGRIRRVLVDADGVVLDMGRRSRVFTGARREAVMLGATHCVWPGCTTPLRDCQADHLIAWARDGTTAAHNGAPLCGRHNRHKTKGFVVWRDGNGRWHTRRPDGTDIT